MREYSTEEMRMKGLPNGGRDTGHQEVQLSEEEVKHVTRVALDHLAATQECCLRCALPGEREEVARRINPETANVFFIYGEVLDPYGDGGLPEEASCVGRMFFAADPGDGVAVSFYDLPEVTREALDGKWQKANREGWKRLLRGARFEDHK
jgi:hypothetical protein